MSVDSDVEYIDFLSSDEMKVLTDSNNDRIEEEYTRPRVEVWPEDSWQLWTASHMEDRRGLVCSLGIHEGHPVLRDGIPLKRQVKTVQSLRRTRGVQADSSRSLCTCLTTPARIFAGKSLLPDAAVVPRCCCRACREAAKRTPRLIAPTGTT